MEVQPGKKLSRPSKGVRVLICGCFFPWPGILVIEARRKFLNVHVQQTIQASIPITKIDAFFSCLVMYFVFCLLQ